MTELAEQISFLIDGMRLAIRDFESEKISIVRLTWELKSRIAELGKVTEGTWASELKDIWNQLELVNAFFIESGREVLNADEKNELAEILLEIEAKIAAR
ncbi:MAG: hypothetical protein HKL80_07710 [Acidimicrobiales bacterium]|nr:hypothetical protein [Acidimicrobiales bacterium]